MAADGIHTAAGAQAATSEITSISDFVSTPRFLDGDPGPATEWPAMFQMVGWSVCAAVGAILLALLLCAFSRRFTRRISDLRLQVLFTIAWLANFVVYDTGMCTGQVWSLVTNAPMAILHAFGAFILDSDISEIHSPFCDSWIYMLLFSLSHAFAAMVSMLFVIKHFGFNIMARLKMYMTSMFGSWVDATFVFWGFNEATCRMAESILSHFSGKNERCRIIIVKTDRTDDDNPESRTDVGRIFELLSLRNSEMERLQQLQCLTTGTYVNMSLVNMQSAADSDVLGAELKLNSLKRILSRGNGGRLHMLFLSDDETANLHAVSLLLNDITVKALADDCAGCSCVDKVVFHCHARYNSIHRVIEDRNPLKGIKVKVVDSSHINVEMLKQNPALQPVNFVDVRADGYVSSAFNALVVGFSEVGQDSVRFLYEFGAFVGSGDSAHTGRSPFRLHVVDKHMDDLAGSFVLDAPAIKLSIPFVPGRENPQAPITLHKADCRSVDFWLNIKEWIGHLNYVVVATDNDELNISTGVRIFKTAMRYRADMDRLCILMRVHNDDDGHITRIVSHYNRLWAAQSHACDEKHFHQNSISLHHQVQLPLYLFGLDKETYTYANVIDEAHERQAIEFTERYEASTVPGYRYSPDDSGKAWIRNYVDKMQLDGKWAGFYPTFSALMALRRTRGQDMANSMHCLTKRILAETAMRKAGYPDFEWSRLTRDSKTTHYSLRSGEPLDPAIARILEALAKTEHLRWNASHEILGYECKGNPDYKDEIRLHHGCITAWENLNEEIRSYDCNVVDVSLDIFSPDRPIKHPLKINGL